MFFVSQALSLLEMSFSQVYRNVYVTMCVYVTTA